MGFDLSYLKNSPTAIEILTVYRSPVTPPSHHICRPDDKPYERFFYVTRGNTVFTFPDGRTLEVAAGGIVYLPSDCSYTSYWTEPGEFITINFIQRDTGGTFTSFGDGLCLLVQDRKQTFLHAFLEILQCWQSDSLNPQLKCHSMFWGILYDISIYLQKRSIRHASREIYEGVLYLENNYLSDVTVEQLAQLCAVSVSTFRRLFRQLKGVSPITYRNQLRMEKAKMLLQSGEYSVTDVSELVKCANIYYFSRMFKQHYGIAPSEICPK